MVERASRLHYVALLGEFWGPQTNLSKLHSKLRKCWPVLVYFLLLSVNSFVFVFDSPHFKDDILVNPFHWFGNNLLMLSAWKLSFVLEWAKPKKNLIWFGFSKLPFEFVDLEVLKSIGDNLGTFLTSKSDFVEGKVLVKICVLVTPTSMCPISCNIKSNEGI